MRLLQTALLMLTTLAVAYTVPHMPEGDSKFLLSMCVGLLVFFTIRSIWIEPKPRRKAVPYSVQNRAH